MSSSNDSIELLKQEKDAALQKGENDLNNKHYKSAIRNLELSLKLSNEIALKNMALDATNELFLIYSLLGCAHEALYKVSKSENDLILAKSNYQKAINTKKDRFEYSFQNKQDIVKLFLKVALLNIEDHRDVNERDLHLNIKMAKEVFKISKNNEDWLNYLNLMIMYGKYYYEVKKYHKAYKLLSLSERGFYQLYRTIHTPLCEDTLNKIYEIIIKICEIKKWGKRKVKYENKLYDLNNYN